jgi:23S rRNA pseudouridine2605 synthase
MSPAPDRPDGIRLQRVLASAGLGSRRACEELIEEGRVEVDGKIVVEQGMRVDPARAVIKVDGLRIATAPDHVYIALNKPRGVVSTMSDPEGRPSLQEYVGDRAARLFHVGRLDTDTEGLIILTNDGDFAQRLAHPSYEVPKTYLAEIEGVPDARALKRLRDGIRLDDGPVTFSRVKLLSSTADKALVTVTLHEGRNRIVRRTMDAIGHPVRKLSRTAIGPVRLGRLKSGELRELTREELGGLLDLTGQ